MNSIAEPSDRDRRLLNRALAERAAADDDRAVAVLQRRGHYLGGARGAAVDQHRQRRAGVTTRFGGEFERRRAALVERHDPAPVEEDRRRLHALVEQATWVAAKVEDDAASGVGPAQSRRTDRPSHRRP